MVKIQYIGHMKTFRIKVGSNIINRWNKDEIRSFSNKDAEILLKNKDFRIVNSNVKKEKKIEEPKEIEVEEEKEEVTFDLNNDNVVDEKDFSIAAKTLSYAKKQKKVE